MLTGSLRNSRSTMRPDAPHHPASRAPSSRICHAATMVRMPRSRRSAPAASRRKTSASRPGTRSSIQMERVRSANGRLRTARDFRAEIVPQRIVDIREPRRLVNVEHIPRTRDRYVADFLDRSRSPGEDRDPVGQRDRFHEVVGHKDDGPAAALPQLEQLILQNQARLRIQRAERLVHEDHVDALVHERPDDRDPLAHPAGEFMRIMMLKALEAYPLEVGQRLVPPLAARNALQLERDFRVRQRRAPRQQVVVLRDVPAADVDPPDGTSVVQHRAVGRRREPGEEVQHGGLAAAGRAHQRQKLARTDTEVDVPESSHHAAAGAAARHENLVDAARLEHKRRPRRRTFGAGRAHQGLRGGTKHYLTIALVQSTPSRDGAVTGCPMALKMLRYRATPASVNRPSALIAGRVASSETARLSAGVSWKYFWPRIRSASALLVRIHAVALFTPRA